jgi:hypothetical protein
LKKFIGKKNEKRTNNDLQITTQKTKDRATRIQLKIGVNSCDLGQVGSFLRVLRFPPPIKLTSNDIIINIVEITSIETYQYLQTLFTGKHYPIMFYRVHLTMIGIQTHNSSSNRH